MKLKVLLGALIAVVVLYLANRYLNQGNLSRGSLETVESSAGDPRVKFTVGFLPVT